MAGTSWEGFVIENLIAAAPERTIASFYRTAAGAEIDLLLEIPGHETVGHRGQTEPIRSSCKGFYIACQELKPYRLFVANAGLKQYPINADTVAIGIPEPCPDAFSFDDLIPRLNLFVLPPGVALSCVCGHMRRRHSSHISASPETEASFRAAHSLRAAQRA